MIRKYYRTPVNYKTDRKSSKKPIKTKNIKNKSNSKLIILHAILKLKRTNL